MGVGRGAFRVFVNLIRNPYHSVESYKLIVLPILYVSSTQRIEVVKEVPADSNNIHSSQLLLYDNAKTFKAASKTIRDALESPEMKQFYNSIQLKWNFNLERAPWWGGLFERMVQSTKKCLRKTIGSAKLTYDELLTALTEVEGILNSRPLTYISSDDVEEPLTPSIS